MNKFITIMFLLSLVVPFSNILAADVTVTGDLDTGIVATVGNILTQNTTTIGNEKRVWFLAKDGKVSIYPGFSVEGSLIAASGTLNDIDADEDGLWDGWELQYFASLGFNAGDDNDSDGLTNQEEQSNGIDPSLYSLDHDNDGIIDRWELINFGDISQGADGDYDGDGFSNLFEFNNGLDPNSPDNRAVYYEYDNLGRIIKIIRRQ